MGISQLTSGQSGLLLPSRNGFLNRIIFRTPGAISFTLPTWANTAKLAVFGAGGGGSLFCGTNPTFYPPNGGAGGGFAQKLLTGVAGLTLTGTVGAAGLGGANTAWTNTAQSILVAGGNGGTSTVSLAGVTLSATGGQGAPSPAAGNVAAGGAGSGGDTNANGGPGGSGFGAGNSQQSTTLSAGGGSSGSPRGDGYRGGNGAIGSGGTIYAFIPGAGAGWGGQGGDAILSQSTVPPLVAGGGGSRGPGVTANVPGGTYPNIFGGLGTDPIVGVGSFLPSGGSNWNNETKMPQPRDWWDVEDIGGWGGGYTYAVPGPRRSASTSPSLYDAGDGGGGAAGSNAIGSTPGFGGGGPGCTTGGIIQSPVPGGVGGGGGGIMFSHNNLPNVGVCRANDGGPGCIILWF